MLIGNQKLIVRLGNGKELKEYYHEGNHFIEGRKKSSFEIVVRNSSPGKIKAIVSVDGLSVIDGKPAGSQSQGYVVEGYGETVIKGWRTSDTSVNEFYFSGVGKSYSSRVGEGNANVGVIGAMIFNEVVEYRRGIVSSGWTTYDSTGWKGIPGPISIASVATAAAGREMLGQNMGTGFGDELHAPVRHDHSKFQSTPDNIMLLYYDDRAGLERRGIVVDETKAFPNAFPSYVSSGKYAKRPI